jgi:tetratricopeptide (TPR) repeat protein
MGEAHRYAAFGPALKALRKQAGLTQEELGRRVNYSREYIAYLESGQRKPDVIIVASLFVPALELTHNPEDTSALIELAAGAHGKQPRDFGIRIARERKAGEPPVPPDTLKQMLSWYVQMRPEAALEMATAMGPFWRANGQFSEARAWLRDILAHSTSPTVSRGEALLHAADFARHQGDLAESIALYDEACALFTAHSDAHNLCMALCQQAWAFYDTNHQQAEALAALERGLSIARRTGDKAGVVEALGALAHMQMAGAATDAARDAIAAMLEEALHCAQELDDGHKRGFLSQQLAALELSRGQVRAALAHFEQAVEAFRVTGDVFSVAWSQSGCGECALLLGDLAGARRCFEQGQRTFEATGGREGVLILTHHLARVDLLTGRLIDAANGFARCLALCDASDYPQMHARCLAGLGGVAVRAGQPEMGARLLAAAQRQFDTLPPFLLPPDEAEYAAFADEARRALGDAAFTAAWQAGGEARREALVQQAAAAMR